MILFSITSSFWLLPYFLLSSLFSSIVCFFYAAFIAIAPHFLIVIVVSPLLLLPFLLLLHIHLFFFPVHVCLTHSHFLSVLPQLLLLFLSIAHLTANLIAILWIVFIVVTLALPVLDVQAFVVVPLLRHQLVSIFPLFFSSLFFFRFLSFVFMLPCLSVPFPFPLPCPGVILASTLAFSPVHYVSLASCCCCC